MKFKKIIVPIVIAIVLLAIAIVIFKFSNEKNQTDEKGKTVFVLEDKEIQFTEYDRISQGKYYLLFDGVNTSILNSNGKMLEEYTNNVTYMIKCFNSEEYSDYYYVLDSDFLLKKDGEEIASIKYNSLDFDMRRSSASVFLLDDDHILLVNNTTTSIPDPLNSKSKITKHISYGYVYNFKSKKIYPKIVSYDGIGGVNNGLNNEYLLLKDVNNKYELYYVKEHENVFNKYYAKVGNIDIENNSTSSLSTKYMYVCAELEDDLYNNCGIYKNDGVVKITPKYDDNTLFDYNDEYYVIKKGSFMYLYDYSNITKLSDFDYIMLSSKYIVAFKDEVMNIYNYKLEKLKSIDTKLSSIIAREQTGKSKNIEIVDAGDTIIINTYDNNSLDEGKNEDLSKIKSYVYGPELKETFEGRRIYKVTNYENELIMYYSALYDEKSISKIYLYTTRFEGYRTINMNNNSGNFKILNKCSDLSLGYMLDNNYTIFNPKFDSPGTVYTSEIDYNNSICNDSGNYNTTNTILYTSNNQKIVFNRILSITKTDDDKYLIMHDNKVGIFKSRTSNK